MACARCGAQVATDTTNVSATLRAPNGAPLYVDVVIHTSANLERTRSEWFCVACLVSFLELFGQMGTVLRQTRAKTATP